MKKLTALFLALVMTLSLCTVALATDPTPINSIDLSSLKIGEGWAGLTKQQIESKVSGYNANNCKYNQFTILYPNSNNEAAFPLMKGEDYFFCLDLVAKEGFAFEGGDNYAYNGTIKNPNGGNVDAAVTGKYTGGRFTSSPGAHSYIRIGIKFTATEAEDTSINWETLAKGAAIAAGITVVTVGTIHTVKAIKNYKAEKAAAAEAAKLAEMPMVAFGDSGEAVTTLQTELNAQGYDCGEVDGIFGQNTLNAVIAFQTANGLAADGIVGELTWGALL